MSRRTRCLLAPVLMGLLVSTCCAFGKDKGKEVVDPEEAAADPDFAVQGEYVGEGTLRNGKKEKVAAQVIADSGGAFRVVVYRGGLPGDGWKRGDKSFTMQGRREGAITSLEKNGNKHGEIAGGKLTISIGEGGAKMEMKRVERKSPTLQAKPPAGATVLFDGASADKFEHGHLTKMKTLLAGTTTKDTFGSHTLHLEFRLSWKPEARGQGRSNSGVYIHDCYELQVLDSFGLEGRNNECGGFYKIKAPDVNMCLPPMTWQTFDIDFTAPKYEGDKKVSNARVTVRHNGVVIHDDLVLPHGTPGRKPEGPPPRPFHLQGHGNRVNYGNIWVVEKK